MRVKRERVRSMADAAIRGHNQDEASQSGTRVKKEGLWGQPGRVSSL